VPPQYKNWGLHLIVNAVNIEIGTNENAIQKLFLLCRHSRRWLFVEGRISEKCEIFCKYILFAVLEISAINLARLACFAA